jgi:hypothetical protein
LGFRVQGSGFRVRVEGSGFRVKGVGCGAQIVLVRQPEPRLDAPQAAACEEVRGGERHGRMGINFYLEKGIQTTMAQGRSTYMIKRIRTSRLSIKKCLS